MSTLVRRASNRKSSLNASTAADAPPASPAPPGSASSAAATPSSLPATLAAFLPAAAAASAASVLAPEQPAKDLAAKGKRRLATDTTDAVVQLLNEASVGLYRIQEHVFRRTPRLLALSRDMTGTSQRVESAAADVADALALSSRMGLAALAFARCVDRVNALTPIASPPAAAAADAQDDAANVGDVGVADVDGPAAAGLVLVEEA
ncbi:hypothetical protein HK405_009881 [Cladochytrium tenue]|nr:hypothetical protein HK405_009881 [Cladochytrium tenue]